MSLKDLTMVQENDGEKSQQHNLRETVIHASDTARNVDCWERSRERNEFSFCLIERTVCVTVALTDVAEPELFSLDLGIFLKVSTSTANSFAAKNSDLTISVTIQKWDAWE